MTQIILIILGVVIVALLVFKKTRESLRQAQSKFIGICSVALEQTVRKNANKEKALLLLKERGAFSMAHMCEPLVYLLRAA